jgi:hypothetical protein
MSETAHTFSILPPFTSLLNAVNPMYRRSIHAS